MSHKNKTMGSIVASTLAFPPNATDNTTQPNMLEARTISHLDAELYNDFYSLWITLMVVNTLMFTVGIVLNTLALYVFCVRTRTATAPVIYTINLAVADLLVALSLPARIALYYSGGHCQACVHVHTFSYFVNMYCSILFLTSICVDRYLAVVWAAGGAASLRWRSPGVARGVSAGVWIFAVVITYSLQTTASIEFGSSGPSSSYSCCQLPLLFALTILEFVLPLLAIVGFTARVACALADRRLMPQSRGRRRRAVRLLVAVLLVFAICFTPFHVRQAVVYFGLGGNRAQHVVAYHATVTLSSLNSCLDPVVYCFVPDGVRSALRRPYQLAAGWRGALVDGGEPRTSGVMGGGGNGAADGDVGDGDADSVRRSPRSPGSPGSTTTALAHSMATLTLSQCALTSAELSV